ncbi:TlpA family protein disulfide reductase [Massilia sp. TN1-12]|uniref:TlpA family protein disulfide reductase n=1 Tax=Massilia paldalensis TaxID=3377675 RepID=UPI00384F292B
MTIGPFSFAPGVLTALLALFAALGVGNAVARRASVNVERALWLCAAAALLAGRASFVARWWSGYAADPLRLLDLRDGGFDAPVAAIAAVLCGALLAWRQRPARGAIAAGLAAAFLAWGASHLWWTAREPAGALPALTLETPDGARIDLRTLAGQPVVLNLWATWCPPCRREMPLLARAQRAHPGVRFVFVNQGEDAAAVAAYLRAAGVELDRLLLDRSGALGRATGSPGLPTTLFFDAGGHLVGRRIGELSEATLASHLQAAGAPAASAPTTR